MSISELTLWGRAGYGPRECAVQVSLDCRTFHTVSEATLEDGEVLKAVFEPRQAKVIRLLFTSAYDANPVNGRARNVQVAEIALPEVGLPAVSSFRPIRDLHLTCALCSVGCPPGLASSLPGCLSGSARCCLFHS